MGKNSKNKAKGVSGSAEKSQPEKNQGKIFVLDTNVLLYDPTAYSKFPKHEVIIPLVVIEELDTFKSYANENGRNARYFSRILDKLRPLGKIYQGVTLENDTRLKVAFITQPEQLPDLPSEIVSSKHDHQILHIALQARKENPKKKVVLITKDTNLRIIADVVDLETEDYDPSLVEFEDLYQGYRVVNVDQEVINEFRSKRKLLLPYKGIYPNEYYVLQNSKKPDQFELGRYHAELGYLVPLQSNEDGVWGIRPKNVEQMFAIDSLLNDEMMMVTLVGKAGTGKTLLATAVGLYKAIDEAKFQRLLISRPIYPVGKDIGYLPGDISEKLNPWMQPFYDNIDFILGSVDRKHKGGANELINQGLLQIEPLTYIRGRSIANQFLIVDEAQNLTPHELKTIITRAGENTKIVLTGDCYQIDNPYIDASSNGLTVTAEAFKNQAIAGHITLTKGERSKLAEVATQIL